MLWFCGSQVWKDREIRQQLQAGKEKEGTLVFFLKRRSVEITQEQEDRFREFKKQLEEEPLTTHDYIAMVLGAFMALWPALLVVIALIVGSSLMFFL